jgi:predicted molibdopterin-dependent oxidoreductase YjgC
MGRFTEEQLRDIEDTRARLEAYCNKGRFYPPLSEEPDPISQPIYQDREWTARQWDAVNQARAQGLHILKRQNELEKLVREHINPKPKKKSKYA